jgi:hypothetical protein
LLVQSDSEIFLIFFIGTFWFQISSKIDTTLTLSKDCLRTFYKFEKPELTFLDFAINLICQFNTVHMQFNTELQLNAAPKYKKRKRESKIESYLPSPMSGTNLSESESEIAEKKLSNVILWKMQGAGSWVAPS